MEDVKLQEYFSLQRHAFSFAFPAEGASTLNAAVWFVHASDKWKYIEEWIGMILVE